MFTYPGVHSVEGSLVHFAEAFDSIAIDSSLVKWLVKLVEQDVVLLKHKEKTKLSNFIEIILEMMTNVAKSSFTSFIRRSSEVIVFSLSIWHVVSIHNWMEWCNWYDDYYLLWSVVRLVAVSASVSIALAVYSVVADWIVVVAAATIAVLN